jgi:phage gp45-like
LGGNEIEVEDSNGNLAVRIHLNENGPVVELDGAKLQLKSTKAVNVECQEFNVNAENNVYMNAGGHLTLESTEELHINCEVDIRLRAKVIWLN